VTAPPNPFSPPAARISREKSGDAIVRPRGLSIVAIVAASATVITAGIATRATIRRMRLTLTIHIVQFVAVFVIALFAVYLPVFALGRVV
jgi:hypothetical protein